jgi:hypothetical protein
VGQILEKMYIYKGGGGANIRENVYEGWGEANIKHFL